jgi:hypothetical protein
MNASDFRWVDDPSVQVSGGGEIVVAWVDQARKDVLLQRYAPDGTALLEVPTVVSKNPATFSWLPRVRVAEEEPARVFVLWQEIVFSGGSHGGEILFARSLDGGRTFESPANLSSTPAGDGKGRLDADTWDNGSLDLALGSGGELYAAWTEYEGALWLRRSTDDGATFGPAVRVAGTAAAPARAPAITTGPDGTVHVAWATGEDPSADIRYARSTNRGETFVDPLVVGRSGSHSDAPSIAVDGKGAVHLFYSEGGGGRNGSPAVYYSRKPKEQSDFEAPRRLSERAGSPRASVDVRDRILVGWEMYPDDEARRPRGLAFTYSSDGGDRFAPAAPVPGLAPPRRGVNGSQQGMLGDKLDVGRTGTIAVVNSTFVLGEASEVLLVRGRLAE